MANTVTLIESHGLNVDGAQYSGLIHKVKIAIDTINTPVNILPTAGTPPFGVSLPSAVPKNKGILVLGWMHSELAAHNIKITHASGQVFTHKFPANSTGLTKLLSKEPLHSGDIDFMMQVESNVVIDILAWLTFGNIICV